jgi:hypothetical protein
MQALSSLTKWSLILIICCSVLALALLLSQARGQNRNRITPTAVSAPNWTEYDLALALEFLPQGVTGVCEWEILGQTAHDVFVWAVCQGSSSGSGSTGMSAPAVIHLAADGKVQSVVVPRDGTLYSQDVTALFPIELHERIFNHALSPEMEQHLQTRLAQPETPPLVVLTATPAP